MCDERSFDGTSLSAPRFLYAAVVIIALLVPAGSPSRGGDVMVYV